VKKSINKKLSSDEVQTKSRRSPDEVQTKSRRSY